MNFYQIHLIFSSIAILISDINASVFSGTDNYCELGEDHTMCKWRTNEAGSSCGKVLTRDFITKENKMEIVKAHNILRAKVARGEETRGYPGPQPPASNMLELVWDVQLELIARRWASQCIFGHDPNRDIGKIFGIDQINSVGQNAYMSRGMAWYGNYTSMTNNWYEEVRFAPNNTVLKITTFASKAGVFGHYTQFVWAKSRRVGCSAIVFKNKVEEAKHYFCNYGPGGNIVTYEVYKIGPPASNCPKEYPKPSLNYDGLCSDGKEDKVSFGGAAKICCDHPIIILILKIYTIQLILGGTV